MLYIFNENQLRSYLPVMNERKKLAIPSFSSSPALGLWGENNKLNASDVCGCGLINLCSKLLLHTISLPIDLQVLRGRAVAKVWRCGTSSGNRPRPNCLFFVKLKLLAAATVSTVLAPAKRTRAC